jgi:hypothetical protein
LLPAMAGPAATAESATASSPRTAARRERRLKRHFVIVRTFRVHWQPSYLTT